MYSSGNTLCSVEKTHEFDVMQQLLSTFKVNCKIDDNPLQIDLPRFDYLEKSMQPQMPVYPIAQPILSSSGESLMNELLGTNFLFHC
jgi:hypothetical protein